jgi:hypothetical protein
MLGVSEIQEHLDKIDYLPRWTFKAHEDASEGPYIRFLAEGVQDSYDLEKTLDIGFSSFISPNDRQSVETLLTYIRYRLERYESHECREFFRYDGEIVFDPHKVER